MPDSWSLPLQGRPEREHLYRWVSEEEEYVAGKFDDQRNGHDESLRDTGLEGFWSRQIVQYLDRAQMFLEGAQMARRMGKDEDARHLEMRAQQAMTKCMMTTKGLVESSIRVFGALPKPGVPSGTVEPWVVVDAISKKDQGILCSFGHHPDRSCLLPDDYHMVFSRVLTDEEWTVLASRIDSTWDSQHSTWDPELVTTLVSEIAPDVECSFYEPRN